MDSTTKVLVNRLAMSLMTKDNDVSEESYGYLRQLLEEAGETEIIAAVDACDGRFYLPERFDDNSDA